MSDHEESPEQPPAEAAEGLDEVEPTATPDLDTELEDAIARFDARQVERTRATIQANKAQAPFRLRDVDRRVWLALGGVLVLIGMGLGGAPWHQRFWIALAALAIVVTPFTVGALFLWQRQR